MHGIFLEEYHTTSRTSQGLEKVTGVLSITKKSIYFTVSSKQHYVFTQKLQILLLSFILTQKYKAQHRNISMQTLWVVVVTISQNSKGLASTDAATSPLMWAISIIRKAPTWSAIFPCIKDVISFSWRKKFTQCRETSDHEDIIPENAQVQNILFSCEDNQCLEDKH